MNSFFHSEVLLWEPCYFTARSNKQVVIMHFTRIPYLKLSGNEIQILLTSGSELAATTSSNSNPFNKSTTYPFSASMTRPIFSRLWIAVRIIVPLAYQSERKKSRTTHMVVVRVAHSIAVLSTEVLSQSLNSNTRSHVEVASDGSYT